MDACPPLVGQVCLQVLEWCYQALGNLVLRREHAFQEHRRLLDKKQRVDLILASMRQNGAAPQQIEEVRGSARLNIF